MDTKIAVLDGIEIEYYFKLGKSKDRKIVVFINGAGRDLCDWENVVASLDSSVSALCFNRLGVGKSSLPTSPQTAKSGFELLIKLMYKLALSIETSVIIVTHSLGSLIAQIAIWENKMNIVGLLFIEPTTKRDVKNVFKKRLYISQNTFSESDNVQLSISQIEVENLHYPVCSVIVGTKLYFIECVNPFSYRKKHISCIKQFARMNSMKLISASRSRHFPMESNIEIVNKELQLVVDSI